MILDAGSKRVRRHQVHCFRAGIVTVFAVTAYRIFVTVAETAGNDATHHAFLDTWLTNGIILWFMALFVMAWIFWRDARCRQDKLATVMRSIAPDVLLVTDADGKVVMCNPAVQAMFGYRAEDLICHTTGTFLHDRVALGVEQEIYDRLRRAGCEMRAGTGIRQDGTPFLVEITTAKLLDQNGTVMLIRDITEHRRVEQSRENMTHMLVHDLRNPLFGISGNLNLISMCTPNLPEDAQTSVKVALDFVQNINEMLRCLVDVSQFETGDWPLRPADSDIGELVDNALAPVAELAKEKRHSVVWSRTSAPVRCDPELIGRVAQNLIRNAVDATPSGGLIEIRVEHKAGTLRVSVSDNGPGVPREFHALIFEKCGQTPDGRKVKRRSSGLGLVFCKLAVEVHGGSIWVESDTDQGSTFWFELPSGSANTGSIPPDA
jgi:PAS domain S-box-containing protein